MFLFAGIERKYDFTILRPGRRALGFKSIDSVFAQHWCNCGKVYLIFVPSAYIRVYLMDRSDAKESTLCFMENLRRLLQQYDVELFNLDEKHIINCFCREKFNAFEAYNEALPLLTLKALAK